MVLGRVGREILLYTLYHSNLIFFFLISKYYFHSERKKFKEGPL